MSIWLNARSVPARYSLAVLLAFAAQLSRAPLQPPTVIPFITYLPFVLLAAAFGGFWPGLATTVLCALESVYFAVEPLHTFRISDAQDWQGLITLLVTGVVSSAVFEWLQRSQRASVNMAGLLDQTYDAVIVWETGPRGITFWNKGALDLYGYSQEEAVGQVVNDLLKTVFPASRERAMEALQRRGHWEGVLMHRARDGRSIAVESRMSARVADGVMRVMEVNRDTTARTEAAAAARQANEERERHVAQLEAVLDTMVEGLIVADLQGNRIRWNPAAIAMHGFRSLQECPRNQAEVMKILELSTEEGVLPAAEWPLERILRGEALGGCELQLRDLRDDSRRVFRYGGTLARDENGTPLLAVMTVTDVTATKAAERALVESERKYSALFANKTNAITHCRIITGPDGAPIDYEVIQVNEAWLRMAGKRREDVEGRRIREIYPEIGSAGLIQVFGRVALEGGEESREAYSVALNRWLSIYAYSPQRGEFVALSMDVTERKHAEDRVRESEERLRLIIESAVDLAIITLDQEGRVSSWNSGAMRVEGYAEEEIIGRHVSVFYTEEDRRAGLPEALLNEALKVGHAHDEGWRIHKDGSLFWADVTVNVLRNADGTARGFASFVRDFSERQQAASERARLILELARKNRELERSNSDLEQFAYAVSHDLQEPLRMVTAYVHLLSNRLGPVVNEAGGKEFMEYITSGAERMQIMIQDILAFSRVSRAEVEHFDRVDLNELVQWARQNLAVAIAESGAEVSSDSLPVVHGDSSQLALVFQNLIGNAIKYRGECAPYIRIQAALEQDEWRIAVRDNGPGIAAAHHESIFGLFKRLHGTAAVPGTGLGLAICRRIIERHGGRIWVESEPGQGATFLFTIPGRRDATA